MIVEKIFCISMAVGTQVLMLIDELRRLVVFEMAACTPSVAKDAVR